MNKEQIRQALARGYCTEANSRKTVDPVLMEAMADEVLSTLSAQKPVAYVALDRWMSGKDWAADCFSECPVGDCTTPLYPHPAQPGTVKDLERELTAEKAKVTELKKAAWKAHASMIGMREQIEDWGGYASGFFQERYDLDGDLKNAKAAIEELRTALEEA